MPPKMFTIELCTQLPLVATVCWILIFLLNRLYGGLRLFFDVWSENAALFERLMEIHTNPPILYYGFNPQIHASILKNHSYAKAILTRS